MAKDLDNDLLLVQEIRENIKRATEKAEELIEEESAEGAIFAFHVVDVDIDPSKRKHNYRAIHTEIADVGKNASEGFQKNFLRYISGYHKRMICGSRQIIFGKWENVEAAHGRIIRPLNDNTNVDAFLAVWGCPTEDLNQKLLAILTSNL